MAVCSIGVAALPVRGAVQRLANRTILFQRGEYLFATFGLFAGLAAFAGGVCAAWLLLSYGLPWSEAALILAGILVGHLVFARAFLLPWRVEGLRKQPLTVLRTVEFASWGGFAAIAVALGLYSQLSGLAMLDLTDIAVRSGTLAHAIGRLGCFSFGCCFGRPTNLPLGVRYESPLAKAARVSGLRGVPLHPVPLYECALNLVLFGVLNGLAFAGAAQGLPTALYLIAYGSGRFLLEGLRYNGTPESIGPLHRNQWLSLAMVISGALLLPFGGAAPSSLTPGAAELLAMVPVLAAASGVVFLAYSLHRGAIGRW